MGNFELANKDRTRNARAVLQAIHQRDQKRYAENQIMDELRLDLTEDAAKLYGVAHTTPDGAYFNYHTEVGAAQDAVRQFVGELLGTNPYLIHAVEAVIQNRQQELEGEK
ncbi:MAG: hypothetical protein QFB87_03550 [Patescibacteria group bacterium]|nr:hypothetical protein [Patescibacteria group bacterium]